MEKIIQVDNSKIMLEDNNSLLKKIIKFFQKQTIERLGFRVNRIDAFRLEHQIDLREVAMNPIEAVYRAGHSLTSSPIKWVIIDVPMDKTIRFPMAFGINSSYADPFAQTAKDLIEGKITTYNGSALERYFNDWQPQNAADLLGLDNVEANKLLLAVPAYGAVCPWDYDSPQERSEMNKDAGWVSSGPVSGELAEKEFSRFKFVTESIVKNGYHRNSKVINGDIGAQVLVKGSEWKILVCDGMHRFATLRALGWKRIPVSLRRWPMMIRREDVNFWPNVVNSLFSVDSALKVFDLFFEANQPLKYQGYRELGE